MNIEDRTKNSETHQFHIIFPNAVNDNGILFGGRAMQWMDEVAYISAIRFTRTKVVTVSVNNLKFKKAIKPGELVDIIGKVIKVGRVKIGIQVDIFVENSVSDIREKAVEAIFTFTAVNEDNKPIALDWEKLKDQE